MAEKSGSGPGQKTGRFKDVDTRQDCPPALGGGLIDSSPDEQGAEPLAIGVRQKDGKMEPKETVEAIVAELFRRMDSFPWGTRGRIQRKLNVNKNFFSRWKNHPSRVRLLQLLESLEYLELVPEDFFASVFKPADSPEAKPAPAESDTETRLKALADLLELSSAPGSFFATAFTAETIFPSGVPPVGVQKALQRMATASSHKEESPPQIGKIIDAEELARLETLRLDNPRKANKLLECAIAAAPMELLAEILSAYGVTFRQLDKLNDARWAYFAARKCSNDLAIHAAILQRLARVEDGVGNPTTAMENLRQASGIFTELASWNQVGKVLVDQAILFLHRGNCTAALKCATSALTKLAKNEYENRFTAYQVQAQSYRELRSPADALERLNAARQIAPKCSKAARIRFVWLHANVRRDSMHPLEAAVIFEEAATFFNESGEVLSELLATLEFANCHLLAGNHAAVNMTALTLKRFVFKDTSQLVKTVIMNVYRAGIENQKNDFATTLMGALGAVKAAVENATAANPN